MQPPERGEATDNEYQCIFLTRLETNVLSGLQDFDYGSIINPKS